MIQSKFIQIFFLLLFISCLNAIHIARESHQAGKYEQSYSNVCITAMDPRGNGKIVFLSIHSDSAEKPRFTKLYSVGRCLSNEKWDLIYQPESGTYCMKALQFGLYLSNKGASKRSGTPEFVENCSTMERFKFVENESGGFYMQGSQSGWYLSYSSDKSTPYFYSQFGWNFWISNGYQ